MKQQVVLPSYIVGEDALAQSAQALSRYGRRALIIGGNKALAAAGRSLNTAVAAAGLQIVSQEWYGGECTYEHMERLACIARERQAEFILGVGGGKALDTAKGCAHMTGLPVITVPTIASTCAAVTAISVVYDNRGVFIESMFHDAPPAFAVIDLGVIAAAPACYLRAGIGDAMAKHVECTLASRGRLLNHSSGMAVALSSMTFEPHLTYGEQAIKDAQQHVPSEVLGQVVLANIVSTGMVSLLVDEIYNGAIAHALFYGMTKIPGFEAHVLHGDAVGYGILVQEMVDGQHERFERVRSLLANIGIPVTFAQMGYQWTEDLLSCVVPASLAALNNARVMPYTVTEDMLREAILAVERNG